MTQLHGALEVYLAATQTTQGDSSFLYEHFTSLEYVLDEIWSTRETFKELIEQGEAEGYTYLANCATASWETCEKYYSLADRCPIYYAAILLNPTLKANWFQQHWGNDPKKSAWINTTVQAVKDAYADEYSQFSSTEHKPSSQSTESHPDEDNAFRRLHRHKRLRFNEPNSIAPVVRTDLDEYLERDPVVSGESKFDSLSYWFDRRNTYPGLVRLAFDTLAIPTTSAADERTFSAAAVLLNDRRNRLLADTIEANEFLRDTYGRPAKGAFDIDLDAEAYTKQKQQQQEWEEEARSSTTPLSAVAKGKRKAE